MAVRRLVMGIDEAGRGPLIGPMIVAAVALPVEALDRLTVLGVRDSKKLSREAREKLYPIIVGSAAYVVTVEVPPETIDSANLNTLERDTIAYLAARARMVLGEALTRIAADTVGSPETLARAIREVVGSGVEIVVRERAEEEFTEVAAASIVAKVVRDRRVRELAGLYGDFGSGYPTDPKTIEWVRRMYMKSPDTPPPIVRRTWSTLRRIAPRWYVEKGAHEVGQRSLLDYLKGAQR